MDVRAEYLKLLNFAKTLRATNEDAYNVINDLYRQNEILFKKLKSADRRAEKLERENREFYSVFVLCLS